MTRDDARSDDSRGGDGGKKGSPSNIHRKPSFNFGEETIRRNYLTGLVLYHLHLSDDEISSFLPLLGDSFQDSNSFLPSFLPSKQSKAKQSKLFIDRELPLTGELTVSCTSTSQSVDNTLLLWPHRYLTSHTSQTHTQREGTERTDTEKREQRFAEDSILTVTTISSKDDEWVTRSMDDVRRKNPSILFN